MSEYLSVSPKRRGLVYPGPVHLFLSYGIFRVVELARNFSITVVLEDDALREIPSRIRALLSERGIEFVQVERKRFRKKHLVYRQSALALFSDPSDFLLIDNDMGEFNVYLSREAKRRGCPVICYQTGLSLGDFRDDYYHAVEILGEKWANRHSLPQSAGRLYLRLSLRLRHAWHYWVAPLSIGLAPFPGKSSIYLRTARSCHRDGDIVLVFEPHLRERYVKDGIAADRVRLVRHPLSSLDARSFFEDCYPGNEVDGGILILVDWPMRGSTDNRSTMERIVGNVERLVAHIVNQLPDVRVWIKPHPAMFGDAEFLELLNTSVGKFARAKLVDPAVNALNYLSAVRLTVGERSSVLDIAQHIGEGAVVAVGISGSLKDNSNVQDAGLHVFPDLEDILAADLSGLRKIPPEVPDSSPTVTDAINKVVSGDG